MILTPDTSQGDIYNDHIAPSMGKGKTLMFAHGFNIRYGTIDPPQDDRCLAWSRPRRPDTGCAKYSPKAEAFRPDRRAPGRIRQGACAGALVRERHRLHPRRRH